MSIMIHWPRRGYSYTGLPPSQRVPLFEVLQNVHIAAGVVTSDIPAFGHIVVRAGVRAEEPTGNFVLLRGPGRRLKKGLASELLSYQLPLTPPGVVRTDIVLRQSKVCWGGAAYGDRQIQGRGEGE